MLKYARALPLKTNVLGAELEWVGCNSYKAVPHPVTVINPIEVPQHVRRPHNYFVTKSKVTRLQTAVGRAKPANVSNTKQRVRRRTGDRISFSSTLIVSLPQKGNVLLVPFHTSSANLTTQLLNLFLRRRSHCVRLPLLRLRHCRKIFISFIQLLLEFHNVL